MNDAVSKPPHIFNYQLQRLMIGLVALALPILVMCLGCNDLTSISASYHTPSRDIFVACLSAVGLLMIPYQGKDGSSKQEFWLAKVGGVAAIVVAFLPTDCPEKGDYVYSCLVNVACNSANQTVHLTAAVFVFGSLSWLCVIFRKRALDKFDKTGSKFAKYRARIYELCIAGIVVGAVISGLYNAGIEVLGQSSFFWGEAIMLFAFSFAWLTASKIILPDGVRPRFLPG